MYIALHVRRLIHKEPHSVLMYVFGGSLYRLGTIRMQNIAGLTQQVIHNQNLMSSNFGQEPEHIALHHGLLELF